jgi:FAD/FMN-containing dehydrogenase
MSTHWICFPTLIPGEPPRVSLFMKWREGFWLADGSDTFVRRVLAEIGVHEPVRAWTFQRYRACYFAPDFEDTNWDDLWAFAWKLDAELAAPPSRLDPLPEGRLETDVCDDTWSSTNNPLDSTSSRCLVIGDFRDAAGLRAARARVSEMVPAAVLTEGIAFARFPQLHVDLGLHDNAWYAAGAAEAEQVRRVLDEHDAVTFLEHSITRAFTE